MSLNEKLTIQNYIFFEKPLKIKIKFPGEGAVSL